MMDAESVFDGGGQPMPGTYLDGAVSYDQLNRHQRDILAFNHHESAKPYADRHEIVMAWDADEQRQFVGTGPYDPKNKSFVVRLPETVNNLSISHSHPSGLSFTLEDVFEAGNRQPPHLFVQSQVGSQYFLGELEPPRTGWPSFDEDERAATLKHYETIYSLLWANISEASRNPASEIQPGHTAFLVRHQAMVAIARRFGLKYSMAQVMEVPHASF